MLVFFVEGNIGAGKSEFLKAMKKVMECVIIPEPVPYDFLKFLYTDPKTWAFPFQLIMAIERKLAQNEALKAEKETKNLVFLERSLYADGIFAEVCIPQLQLRKKYKVYTEEIIGQIIAKPDLIIYLRSNPESCLKRIKERMSQEEKRKCESVVSLDYLNKLHIGHENWMNSTIYPVFTLNTENLDWRKEEIAKKIANKIKNLFEHKGGIL